MSNRSNRQIKYGALISYGAIFINVIIALLYTPWMTRQIGQSNYGLYTLAVSFISLFLFDFGIGKAVSRFLAKYRAENNLEKAEEFLGIVTRLYLWIDLVVFVILFVLYFFVDRIYQGLTPEELVTFKQLYLIVGFFSILSFPFVSLTGVLEAYEKFIQMKLCELGQKLMSVVLIILALVNHFGVQALVTANAISGLTFIVVKLLVIRKTTPLRMRKGTSFRDRSLVKEIFTFSIWAAVIGLMQRCIFSLAPSILGIVSNSREIAIFSPANVLEGYFYTFAAAINGLFLARISKYIAEDEGERIYRLMVKVGRYQMVVLGLIFVEFFCIGHEFMVRWMGEDYEGAWICAVLLFIPDILLFSEDIANTAVIAQNEMRRSAQSAILMAAVALTVSFFLCRPLGALGSCIAIMLAYTARYIYMNFVYHKYLKLNIPLFFKECYRSFLLPILIACIGGWFLCNRLFVTDGIGFFVIRGVLVLVLFLVLVLCFALRKEERKAIMERIRRTTGIGKD